jgi:hypothetical protein
MRVLVRQLFFLLISILALYALLLLVSLPFGTGTGTGTRSHTAIDSGLAGASIYATEPKYVFLDRAELSTDKPRVILVGASNVLVGLKPREMQPLMPATEIDNMSIGGANMTEVSQTVDLALSQLSKESCEETTFVIGMWYGMFATNQMRWNTPDRHQGDTDLDIERYRYGFYRRTQQGPKPVLPEHDLALGVTLIHPYLVIDSWSRQASHWISLHTGHREPMHSEAERNALVFSDQEKAMAMDYWHEQLQTSGELSKEQFKVLQATVQKIVAHGARVVVVDLPVPRWHEKRSPYLRSYAERRSALLEAWQDSPAVKYLDMTDIDSDSDFSDEVHPKPRITKIWAERVVNALEESSTAGASPSDRMRNPVSLS